MAGEDSQAVDEGQPGAEARVQKPFQHPDQTSLHSKRRRLPGRISRRWSSRRVSVSPRSLSNAVQRAALDHANVLMLRHSRRYVIATTLSHRARRVWIEQI